jgi:ribosome biogenesis GTPase / thiamine phosphate phosphatase
MTIQVSDLLDFGWGPFFQSQIQAEEASTTFPARVMAVHRGRLHLQGVHFESDSPPFFTGDCAATVGDWLLLHDETHRARRLLDRKSAFKRVAAGTAHEIQYIAANIDTVFIVTSCNQDFNVARLERYLALAREAQVTPVIVLTRSDLVPEPEEFVRNAGGIRPGVHVEAVNALDASEVERLAGWCGRGQTVALLGSSGVGKSTLIATLTGKRMETQPIREDDDKGRHTTTRRELFQLPTGGLLLDTPGMRELKLVDVNEGLAEVFADIEAAVTRCRFSDCRHESEPGCAVQEGLQAGTLDAERLHRWRKLVAENARHSESIADRRARERRFGKFAKRVVEAKKSRREDPP